MDKKSTDNQSLTEQAYHGLCRDIISGQWSPLAKLNIERLKQRYSMGGTPIREALNQLVAIGLVEALPLKGFRVSGQSVAHARDIYQCRIDIETQMIAAVLKHGDAEWESECIAMLHRIKRGLEDENFKHEPDLMHWLSLQDQFWQHLLSPCPSPCLLRLQAQINLLRLSYDYRLLAKQEHPITVMQQHYQQMQRLFDLCLDKKATAVIAFFNEWMQQQASAIVIELEKEEE